MTPGPKTDYRLLLPNALMKLELQEVFPPQNTRFPLRNHPPGRANPRNKILVEFT